MWKPSQQAVDRTNMVRFIKYVNERKSSSLSGFDDLYRWSVDDIPDFWEAFWDFSGVIASRRFDQVVDDVRKMPGAKWFSGARLNFAENLLRYRDNRAALIFVGEGREPVTTTYAELYNLVSRIASALKAEGVVAGDRVVGFMPNVPETIAAMLAAASLGAIWSSCSPDFGTRGVLDRFGQIEPKVLFTTTGYVYNGKEFSSLVKISDAVSQIPSVRKVVVVPYPHGNADLTNVRGAVSLDDFLAGHNPGNLTFQQLPADHPLYIMYSSGTTGLPKCMVQSAGGILLHHAKELMLHTDLHREDTVFYFTTCGWMMWNWMVSSLSIGASLVLFDGSPFHPAPEVLWKLAEQVGITVFGTSAKYLAALEKEGVKPAEKFDLHKLRAILSTGSPLLPESYDYVYRDIKKDVQLASISGGTDLNGCFALGNPMGPVHRGELQCRGLAMRVEAFDDHGRPVTDRKGELVCAAAFPSMPIGFWNDPDGSKYRKAYFERFPGVWHHGDFIEVHSETGGVIVYGRSDATLNPGGVRIGTAEIYRVVENIPEVADSLVVGQDWKGDVRVILFVKPAPGLALDEALEKKIRTAIRTQTSPRHVPAKMVQVSDIPYTINMKKVELAVRNVIHGLPVTNRDALRNPEALDLYKDIPALQV